MRPCNGGRFPLQVFQESDQFKQRTKTRLLALMMKSISDRPAVTPSDKMQAQSTAPATQEMATERDVEIQKPLVLRPHKPPPLRLKL
jgi:hypothetical protein